MKYRVLITTSGVGSRLGEFTTYTNKALIRIKRKPIISYIIERYPKKVEFVITLGYRGDYVKQFLEIAYPKRKFVFVEVDKYEGKGSSLLYSMLCAKKHLQMPFIFHASDTLVYEDVPEPKCNWNGGYRGTNSSQYRSFDVTNGLVDRFHDKGLLKPDLLHIGLVGVNDYKSFWKEAGTLIKDDESLSDVSVISSMVKKGHNFKAVEFKEWNDTGNTQSLYETWRKFDDLNRGMDKVGEDTFIIDGQVIKFFAEEKKCGDRIKRAKILKGFVPQICKCSKNFFSYGYVNGEPLSSVTTPENFYMYLYWLQDRFWKDKSAKLNYENFYKEKTWRRLEGLLNKYGLVDGKNTINEATLPSISKLLNMVDWGSVFSGLPSTFHGDLVLDNVIKTKKGFMLIDWREDFAGNMSVGDRYYDLAKIYHSLAINHDVVNKELFTIKIKKNEIFCDILRPARLVECEKWLEGFVEMCDYDLGKLKILRALIWLNMAPLHQYPFDLFLFYWGKYNLWKAL